MSTFKETLKKYKNAMIVISAIAVLIFLNFVQYRSAVEYKQTAEKRIEVAEHNAAAAQDEIKMTKTRSKQNEFNIKAFYTDKVSKLEGLNADLAKEVKDTKGDVSTISKADVTIKHDTVPMPVNIYVTKDSTIVADFSFDTTYNPGNYRKIKGYTKYNLLTKAKESKLTHDETGMSFVTGIKDLEKGTPTIFLRSKMDGFSVVNLEGAVLDPNLFKSEKKQKKLSFGMSVGYSPINYNLKEKKIKFENLITGQVGLSYKFF